MFQILTQSKVECEEVHICTKKLNETIESNIPNKLITLIINLLIINLLIIYLSYYKIT